MTALQIIKAKNVGLFSTENGYPIFLTTMPHSMNDTLKSGNQSDLCSIIEKVK